MPIASVGLFTDQVSLAKLLEPPINVLRVSLHPQGMAPHIVNLAEWRVHVLDRLRRQIALTGDRRARGAVRRAACLSRRRAGDQ